MKPQVLLLDNFDSFTWNIVDFYARCGCDILVHRNDVPLDEWRDSSFDLLVLSPGPCSPREAGNLMEVLAYFSNKKPIFGICLGHQAIVEHFGGSLKFNPPTHGKSSIVTHDGKGVYQGLPPKIEIGRYHSLAADKMPEELLVTANSEDQTVMSCRHKHLPIAGVQYHPESVLSMKAGVGLKIIENSLQLLPVG